MSEQSTYQRRLRRQEDDNGQVQRRPRGRIRPRMDSESNSTSLTESNQQRNDSDIRSEASSSRIRPRRERRIQALTESTKDSDSKENDPSNALDELLNRPRTKDRTNSTASNPRVLAREARRRRLETESKADTQIPLETTPISNTNEPEIAESRRRRIDRNDAETADNSESVKIPSRAEAREARRRRRELMDKPQTNEELGKPEIDKTSAYAPSSRSIPREERRREREEELREPDIDKTSAYAPSSRSIPREARRRARDENNEESMDSRSQFGSDNRSQRTEVVEVQPPKEPISPLQLIDERLEQSSSTLILEEDKTPKPSPLESINDEKSVRKIPSRNRFRQVSRQKDIQKESTLLDALLSFKIGNLFVQDDAMSRYTMMSTVSGPDFGDVAEMAKLLDAVSGDSDGFPMLTLSGYMEEKRKLESITEKLQSYQTKIEVEERLRISADQMMKNASGDEQKIRTGKQIEDWNQNIELLARKVLLCSSELIESERVVMKHMVSALKWQVENVNGNNSLVNVDKDSKSKLISAERKIRELETQVELLTNTVAKLELEKKDGTDSGYNEPEYSSLQLEVKNLRNKLAESEKEKANVQTKIRGLEEELRNSSMDQKDLKEQLDNFEDEIRTEKDKSLRFESQLQTLNEKLVEKDRSISNLRSDLEEANSLLTMSKSNSNFENVLKEANQKVEAVLAMTPVPFSTTSFLNNVQTLIDELQDADQRVKKLKDKAADVDKKYEERLSISEQRLSQLQSEYDSSKAESAILEKNLKNAESDLKKLQLLEEQLKDAERDIEDLEDELAQARKDADGAVKSSQEEYQAELEQLNKKHKHELDKVGFEYEDKLEEMQKKFESRMKQMKEEKDLEIQLAEEEISKKVEKRLKREHSLELELAKSEVNDEMQKVKKKAESQIEEMKKRLEMSENALVLSKQEFFAKREALQEQIDQLEERARSLELQSSEKNREWEKQKSDYDAKIDQYLADVDKLEQEIKRLQENAAKKDRELDEQAEKYENEIKQAKQDLKAEIKKLEDQLDECKEAEAKYDESKQKSEEKMAELEATINDLRKQMQAEKLKASNAVFESQEAQAESKERLDRMQRLLDDASKDSERYRQKARDLDEEILSLKRQIRQKDKEIGSAAISTGSGDSEVVKKLLEQKNKEIEAARSETQQALSQVAEIKRKLEVQTREVEEAKSEIKRRASTRNKEEALQEVDRLQLMLMDLKTSRVDLLEQLDDAQHQASIYKNKMMQYKNELEKVIDI